MPVLTIAGVDAGTDQLNIVAHGLATGDGFLAIYTKTGTYPGGLAAVTNYWAIRVDADHIKLATSSANAMAGTAINITTAGSGTLYILQGLPYRVPRIAAPGVDIESADDNAQWLSLVALWNLLTGQAQTVWDSVKIAVPVVFARANEILPFGIDFNDLIINTGGAGVSRVAGTGGCVLGSGGDAYFKLPPVPQYRRLNQLTAWATDGGTVSGATMRVYKYDETATTLVAASSSVAIATGAVAMPLTTPVANVATVYVLRVSAGFSDITIKKGEYLWDIP